MIVMVISQSLLWLLMQRGLLVFPLEDVVVGWADLSFCLLLFITMATIFVGVFPRSARSLMHPVPVAVAGLLGGISCLLCPVGASGLAGTLADVALLVAMALSFCLVQLAWIAWAFVRARDVSAGRVLVAQFLAVLVSFAVALLEVPSDAPMQVLRIIALPCAAAGLLVCGRLGEDCVRGFASGGAMSVSGEGDLCPRGAFVGGTGRITWGRAAGWVASTGGILFFCGTLSYLPNLGDDVLVGSSPDAFALGLTVVVLVIPLALCLRGPLSPAVQHRRVLVVSLVVAAVISLLAFALAFAILLGGDVQYVLSRCLRRLARVTALALALVGALRLGLDIVRTACLVFLLPVFGPKLALYGASLLMGARGSALGEGFAPDPTLNGIILLSIGLALLLCLGALVFLNFDGRVLESFAEAGDESDDTGCEGDAPDPHERACEVLSARVGLSQREKDVMRLFSLGYSIQRTGEELVIAPGTVNYHSQSLYRKLGVHSKQELMVLIEEIEREG